MASQRSTKISDLDNENPSQMKPGHSTGQDTAGTQSIWEYRNIVVFVLFTLLVFNVFRNVSLMVTQEQTLSQLVEIVLVFAVYLIVIHGWGES